MKNHDERYMDLLLEERLGGRKAPDLVSEVRSKFDAEVEQAEARILPATAAQISWRQRAGTIAAAAMVVVGLGLIGLSYFEERPTRSTKDISIGLLRPANEDDHGLPSGTIFMVETSNPGRSLTFHGFVPMSDGALGHVAKREIDFRDVRHYAIDGRYLYLVTHVRPETAAEREKREAVEAVKAEERAQAAEKGKAAGKAVDDEEESDKAEHKNRNKRIENQCVVTRHDLLEEKAKPLDCVAGENLPSHFCAHNGRCLLVYTDVIDPNHLECHVDMIDWDADGGRLTKNVYASSGTGVASSENPIVRTVGELIPCGDIVLGTKAGSGDNTVLAEVAFDLSQPVERILVTGQKGFAFAWHKEENWFLGRPIGTFSDSEYIAYFNAVSIGVGAEEGAMQCQGLRICKVLKREHEEYGTLLEINEVARIVERSTSNGKRPNDATTGIEEISTGDTFINWGGIAVFHGQLLLGRGEQLCVMSLEEADRATRAKYIVSETSENKTYKPTTAMLDLKGHCQSLHRYGDDLYALVTNLEADKNADGAPIRQCRLVRIDWDESAKSFKVGASWLLLDNEKQPISPFRFLD